MNPFDELLTEEEENELKREVDKVPISTKNMLEEVSYEFL
jgi:hypothetical protein